MLSLGAEGGGAGGAGVGGSIGSSLSFSVAPPSPAALESLDAWKKAVAGSILKPVLLPPLPPPPSPPPAPAPPADHHYHHHHHAGANGCCCGVGSSSSSSSEDSSAASSEEDRVASEDARLQRCVRSVAPNMMTVGTYADVAKMDACAAQGMQALTDGAAPPAVRDAVAACMEAADFAAPLAPFVQDFVACVGRVLT
ncbi:hypothetical protein ONE63_005405 [Megalurothrips usitatus]|uniref:Uncharacterized protein n=1 Tax=Megalurothrips usitatus TaxID=439358 RepID=A0AAV7Y095_9NEOP|nr:hypothetical protein ONE63_005405 [Megalurothrips usitatus]